VCSVLSSQARACRRNHQVPRVPLPDVGVTSIRETCPASSEVITPRSSLLRTHASIPCGSPLLRPFGLVRGVFAGCYQPRRFHRLLVPVSSSVSSAFPWAAEDWLPASTHGTTFPRKSFRDCRHSFTF